MGKINVEAVKKIFECYGNTGIKRVIDNAVKTPVDEKKNQGGMRQKEYC